MRTVIINYKELTDSLTKLEKDYPSRMHGHIDLLRVNIKYNMMQFLSGDILTVELDDSIRMANINGEPIVGDVYAIYDQGNKKNENRFHETLGGERMNGELYQSLFSWVDREISTQV